MTKQQGAGGVMRDSLQKKKCDSPGGKEKAEI